MKTLTELRSGARERLAGNYGTVIGASIIYTLITNMISTPAGGAGSLQNYMLTGEIPALSPSYLLSIPLSIIGVVLSFLLSPGISRIIFEVMEKRTAYLGDLFYCFRNNPLTAVAIGLWVLLYTIPASLIFGAGLTVFLLSGSFFKDSIPLPVSVALLIIASLIYIIILIYIELSVSMVYFLYFDNPEKTAHELLKESFRLMKGRKGKLLSLYLSYAGYYILGFLSCGLALLWVNPNVTGAAVLFYRDICSGEGPETVDSIPVYHASYQQDYWN